MKIVHVVHSFHPLSRGGIESYVASVATAQAQAGHEVCVLAGRDQDLPASGSDAILDREIVEGIDVRRLRRRPDNDGWAIVGQAVMNPRPDVVHVHHWHNLSDALIAASKSAGAGTVVVSLHDFYAVCPLFFRLPDATEPCPPEVAPATCSRCASAAYSLPEADGWKRLHIRSESLASDLDAADAVLAISKTQAGYLRRVPALAGVPIQVLELPRPRVTPAPRHRQHDAETIFSVVSWGGLVRGKGMETLVRACNAMEHAERVRVDHFGRVLDPGFADELLRIATRCRFRICGAYGPRDLAERFPAYDVAVFPSLYMETHGFTVDEALEIGVPVVVSDRGAPRERVGGRGRVFPARDVETLRDLLDELARNPRELARMRAAAPVEPVRIEEHAAALFSLYENARAHRGSITSRVPPPRGLRILEIVAETREADRPASSDVRRLARELERLGHSVAIATSEPTIGRVKTSGVDRAEAPIFSLPKDERAKDAALHEISAAFHPEIVLLHGPTPWSQQLTAVFRAREIPAVTGDQDPLPGVTLASHAAAIAQLCRDASRP